MAVQREVTCERMLSRTSSCWSVEDDLGAGGQEREAVLDVALELGARAPGHRAEAPVEAELRAVVADEVERGQHGFAWCQPQSAPELLEEDGGALGGTQEEDGVDGGHVDALVEDVDGHDRLRRPARRSAMRRRGRAPRVWLVIVAAAMPAWVKRSAMNSAWSIDTQKQRAFIDARSATLSRTAPG